MGRKPICHRLIVGILCTTFLYSCSNAAPKTNTNSQTSTAGQVNVATVGDKDIGAFIGGMVSYDNDDYYSDWKSSNPNYIELNGASASIKGSGAEVKKGEITITAAGIYVVSGKLSDGQIVVAAQDKGVVRLVLNGAEINSSNNSPIYIKNGGKTVVTLEDGTENIVSDGEKYVSIDSSTGEPNAAIFSKTNLTINGKGKLIVKGNYNNGITSKDDLKITGGNIQITSVDDALMGKNMVAVKDGTITIDAGGDGIKATNDTDTSKGFVALETGTFNIKADNDGIQAVTYALAAGGIYSITTGGGSVNGIKKAGDDRQNPMGNKNNSTTTTTNNTQTEKESAKAIKASGEIAIGGGTFNIDSADDAVHSNNSIVIAGGDLSINSGDDGVHADASIVVRNGKINIIKSYEGTESAVITVLDGEIHINSNDDGINVAGGNDGSSINGRPGQNDFAASPNNRFNINGGYIEVNSFGDGLDSNGSIYMTNGTVVVSGPTANNNGALDYNGVFEMSGGFLLSAGSSGMAQATSDESKQYSIIMNYPQVQQADTIVHLQDSKGNTIATFAPKKNYQAVVISSPKLNKDTSYTLYSGGISTGSEVNGLYTGGKYQGGTKVVDFTITNSVTWLNESGVTTAKSSNPGGPGNHGGPMNPGAGGNQNPPVKRP